MSEPASPALQNDYLSALRQTVIRRPGLWIVPLLAGALIGVLMGLFGPKQWGATQTFVVREELIGRIVGPGRFDSLDAMKTAQETISELARRPAVIIRALQTVGPENGAVPKNWPDEDTVLGVQGAISFFAPGGAEFGKTEELTMQVKSQSRERARQLVAALYEEVQQELRSVRQQRAASMMTEMQQAVDLARVRYDETLQKLGEMEAAVGVDLADLRSLNEPIGGSGDLRKMYVQIENEERQIRTRQKVNEELDRHLRAIQADPAKLVVTPRELLESQPVLARLKEKLVDARISLATLAGNFSDRHPRVQAAEKTVRDIEAQIFLELESAIAGLDSQRTISEEEIRSLREKNTSIDNRLSELAAMRVTYSRLVDEMNQRKQALAQAEQAIDQTEAMHRAAETVDFISKIDEAQAATDPLGPGKRTLALGGLMTGFMIGLGLVMLMTPVPPPPPLVHPELEKTFVSTEPRPSNPSAGSSVATVTGYGATFIIPDIGASPVPGTMTHRS
jgi:hypothetical protein